MNEVVRWSGRETRALRMALRLTVRDFAERLGVAERTVGKWEAGGTSVHPYTQCQAALDTLLNRSTSDQLARFERSLTIGHARDKGDESPRPGSESDSESDGAERLNGPDLIARDASDVDPSAVLHWSALLRVLTAHQNLTGPQQTHVVARGEYAVIRGYRRRASGATQSRLLGVEARWAEFCSWTAENSAAATEAVYWLDRALDLAERAEQPATAAYVRMRQAQHAADHRDADRAITLADHAASAPGLSYRDKALCAVRQAHGHALRGDSTASSSAITGAFQLVERANDGDLEDPGTIGGHCGPEYLAAHEAYCRALLGEHAQAALQFEQVLSAWPTPYRQDEALTRTWLALAYCATGRLAEAAVQGSRALTLIGGSHSTRTLRALSRLNTHLRAQPDTREVAEFQAAYRLAALTG